MQRRAQRDDQPDQRVQRAKRLRRALVGAAAVPVILVAAGCSSDSGSDAGYDSAAGSDDSAQQDSGDGASASPTVQAAAYQKLPKVCAVLPSKTLTELVPKAAKSGKAGTSNDSASRGSCSWSSLENKGVKGSQFRWLNVSLLRFDSDTSRGTGEKQAQAYYGRQIQDAQAVAGAKNAKSEPLAGTGDEATTVRYDLKKKEGAFRQQTVVARVENVVVTLDYNGAGLAGEKTPSAEALVKAAQKAAKQAVTAVASANGVGTAGAGTAKPSPSKSSSASSSKAPSKSPSKAAKASPSRSASKKR